MSCEPLALLHLHRLAELLRHLLFGDADQAGVDLESHTRFECDVDSLL